MCVFCKIVNQELPAKIVAENELALSFLDINPVNPGHVLVVVKRHVATLEEINIDELFQVIELVKLMGGRLKDKLAVQGYNIILNNNKIAGQEIEHLHFHVIPRHKNDNLRAWPAKKYKHKQLDIIYNSLTKKCKNESR